MRPIRGTQGLPTPPIDPGVSAGLGWAGVVPGVRTEEDELRSRLTYSNVVATIALFLAISGGVVWAANKITSKQLGKGAVKNKNLAKNAVKAKNLAKNSVTSAKVKNGAVTSAKIGDAAVDFAKIAAGTNVIASATAGPISARQEGFVNVPLSAPLTLTPVAGQPITVDIEARGTLAQTGVNPCVVRVLPIINGNPLMATAVLVLQSPGNPPEPPFTNGIPQADLAFPLGLTQPGKPLDITLGMFGNATECTPASTLDQVAIAVTQAK